MKPARSKESFLIHSDVDKEIADKAIDLLNLAMDFRQSILQSAFIGELI